MKSKINYLVTGVAGFIGYHLAEKLCSEGNKVIGIDNLNDYYDLNLKKSRLSNLKKNKNFRFKKIDLCEYNKLSNVISNNEINIIYHLAAQAGVRYSINFPREYLKSNIEGHFNILESCRENKIKHLIFASSSSVYGLNNNKILNENETTDFPISFYASTKKSNEIMSYSYSHLYNIPTTGIRFFTVYGPWGRPDMAAYKFVQKILASEKIDVYNEGELKRDFTYIDDVVEGLYKLALYSPINKHKKNSNSKFTSNAPFNIFNLGGGNPIKLMRFINVIEKLLDKKADCNFISMQKGDVFSTNSDTTNLFKTIGFKPKIGIEEGMSEFIKWYKKYHV